MGGAQIAPTPASWGLYHTGTSVLCGEGRGRREGREVSWPVDRLYCHIANHHVLTTKGQMICMNRPRSGTVPKEG